jgi:UDP-N-acetyl-D-glucosamine dehydrogenase
MVDRLDQGSPFSGINWFVNRFTINRVHGEQDYMSVIDKIRNKTARITVVGQGYVGLPLAVAFGEAGFDVLGLDSSPAHVDNLNRGVAHTPDVDSTILLELIEKGRYHASTDIGVLELSDVIIICVPTPLRKSKDPDISYVSNVAESIATHIQHGQLVVLESTTYPGTTNELLLPLLSRNGRKVGEDFFLAFSPERIDPANTKFRVRDIPKVIGGVTELCTRAASELYREVVDSVYPVSSPTVAELAKLYENLFRSVNIALANEFALMCRRLDVSTREVIDAAATKPFGFLPFYPGPGVGGHCIPVDAAYLSWKMKLNGYDARFVHLAEEINRAMPEYVVALLIEALNRRKVCLNGARVMVLGVAYKRGVGDTRESPALEVIRLLKRSGAEVSYSDPYVPTVELDGEILVSVENVDELIENMDAVLILTDHIEFDYPRLAASANLIVDTRNATWGIDRSPDRELLRL